MGRMDHQLVFEQAARQPVEQRGPVACVDFDHGKAVGGAVVEHHARAHLECLGAGARQWAPGKARGQFDPVGEGIGDRGLDPFELRFLVERLAERVLHEEVVDRPAIACGVDACVDNVCPGQVDAARDAIEQARMVGSDHAHQRRPARLVIFAMDRELFLETAGNRILHQVALDHVFRLGDPVCVGEDLVVFVDQVCPVAQHGRDDFLLRCHPPFASVPHMAQPQAFLCSVIKLTQQLPFPAVPGSGADRTDIDDGQHHQVPQSLEALHFGDEILDRLGIGQVALLCGGAHQQVVADQPGDQLGLVLVEAEARAELFGHLAAQHRMVASAPLGDIVQQHRHEQRPARCDAVDQLA